MEVKIDNTSVYNIVAKSIVLFNSFFLLPLYLPFIFHLSLLLIF